MGCYDDELAIDCAPEFFISSYTPAIRVFLALDSAPTTKPFQMMAVIQPKELPIARKELEKIEQHVSCEALI